MKGLLGALLILGGIALAGYLGIYLMLYGGIIGAIQSWEIDTSVVVWNIIRAVFFEVGLIPGALLIGGGASLLAAEMD